jgi:hypothetical protein
MKSILPLIAIAILCTGTAFSRQAGFGHNLLLRVDVLNAATCTSRTCAFAKTIGQEEPDSLSVTVTTRDGKEYTGRILYAADTLLVLLVGTDTYTSSALQSSGRVMRISQIDNITFAKESHFWSGLATGLGGGFLTGTVVGLAVANAVDSDTTGVHALGNLGFGLVMGVVFAVPGGLFFGIKGAIEGIDDRYPIDGETAKYQVLLPALRDRAIYPTMAPPAVEDFMKQP